MVEVPAALEDQKLLWGESWLLFCLGWMYGIHAVDTSADGTRYMGIRAVPKVNTPIQYSPYYTNFRRLNVLGLCIRAHYTKSVRV